MLRLVGVFMVDDRKYYAAEIACGRKHFFIQQTNLSCLQMHMADSSRRGDAARSQATIDAAAHRCAAAERKITQLQAELRRRELEVEKLQGRLRDSVERRGSERRTSTDGGITPRGSARQGASLPTPLTTGILRSRSLQV